MCRELARARQDMVHEQQVRLGKANRRHDHRVVTKTQPPIELMKRIAQRTPEDCSRFPKSAGTILETPARWV